MTEIFNIVWRNISDNLLPWFWRDISKFRADVAEPLWLKEYVYSILYALENLTNRLFEFASDIQTELRYDGRVSVLEFCLNDYFDPAQQRIFIDDAQGTANNNNIFFLQIDPHPYAVEYTFYLENETNPSPITLNTSAERAGDYDFDVYVPTGLSYDINRFSQIVERYRIAGMRYQILSY